VDQVLAHAALEGELETPSTRHCGIVAACTLSVQEGGGYHRRKHGNGELKANSHLQREHYCDSGVGGIYTIRIVTTLL